MDGDNVKLYELWDNNFDEIYCLHFLKYKNRVNDLLNELKRVQIPMKKFKWHYTFENPFDNYRYRELIVEHKVWEEYKRFLPLNAFNCAYGHYSIIKQAYDRGLEHILILEDDVRFLKDLNLLYKILSYLPQDYHVVNFDRYGFCDSEKCTAAENDVKRQLNDYYVDMTGLSMLSAACYALDRKGMKMIIENQEKKVYPADWALFHNNNIGYYTMRKGYNIMVQNMSFKNEVLNNNIIILYGMYKLMDVDLSNYNLNLDLE